MKFIRKKNQTDPERYHINPEQMQLIDDRPNCLSVAGETIYFSNKDRMNGMELWTYGLF